MPESPHPHPLPGGEGNVRIMDSTLRDGSHAIRHRFTVEQVTRVAQGLDAAGIQVVEVSHGDGLGGSSLQYGASGTPELLLIEAAAKAVRHAKIAVLLLPGIGTIEDLEQAAEHGAKMVRVATHCTEADICEQHMQAGKKLGMEVVGFLMMAHTVTPEKLLEQAKLMESYGADVVYVTDSAGAMLMEDARQRVQALTSGLKCQVGFHAHNNLMLSVANSVIAAQAGAQNIDGCTCGMGAGAGNTPTEVLVAVYERMGIKTGIDLHKIQDVADDVVRPVMERPQTVDRSALTLGYAGVYSSFLLHAYKAAEQFKVDARDVLEELGRRKVVGGQEDMIVDVANELAQAR
ncbi:MAG: 4-hydroxy-2-oxovalerate aldolase [Chloroflexota bacterium]|nr:4-hydroxy-2-oxovalerate aldolase [Chloroflexota bacterium]